VISYNLYWLFVIAALVLMRYHEVKGHWPLMKSKGTQGLALHRGSSSEESNDVKGASAPKTGMGEKTVEA